MFHSSRVSARDKLPFLSQAGQDLSPGQPITKMFQSKGSTADTGSEPGNGEGVRWAWQQTARPAESCDDKRTGNSEEEIERFTSKEEISLCVGVSSPCGCVSLWVCQFMVESV